MKPNFSLSKPFNGTSPFTEGTSKLHVSHEAPSPSCPSPTSSPSSFSATPLLSLFLSLQLHRVTVHPPACYLKPPCICLCDSTMEKYYRSQFRHFLQTAFPKPKPGQTPHSGFPKPCAFLLFHTHQVTLQFSGA